MFVCSVWRGIWFLWYYLVCVIFVLFNCLDIWILIFLVFKWIVFCIVCFMVCRNIIWCLSCEVIFFEIRWVFSLGLWIFLILICIGMFIIWDNLWCSFFMFLFFLLIIMLGWVVLIVICVFLVGCLILIWFMEVDFSLLKRYLCIFKFVSK